MRDPVGEHARLPGARPGDDEQRAFRVLDGLTLGLVEGYGVGLRLGDGHSPMLDEGAAGSSVAAVGTTSVTPARVDPE